MKDNNCEHQVHGLEDVVSNTLIICNSEEDCQYKSHCEVPYWNHPYVIEEAGNGYKCQYKNAAKDIL